MVLLQREIPEAVNAEVAKVSPSPLPPLAPALPLFLLRF